MEIPVRPSEAFIKNAYDQLLRSGMSLAKIKDSVLADRLLVSHGSLGVVGRSIAWKLFLTSEEPLSPSSLPARSSSLLHILRSSRQNYVNQLREHMRAPDGSYEEGFALPELSTPLTRQPASTETVINLETNNPLSLHTANPWKVWFAAVELRKTILQDVERTFPEIAFFRESETQAQLTNILFLYSVMNPQIGYRQGMHEILAPLYYAVEFDSLSPIGGPDEADVREVCSNTWVAGDAWALFDSVMRELSRWYEWREPSPNAAPRNAISPLTTHVNFNIPDGPLNIKPYTAPIVEACNRIQSTYLRTTDPQLYKHMQAAGIEPQIYGIRWLRLLFTREFNMTDAMKLWDGLFACDPTLELAQWICVAMLIRIRNELMSADYSGQLTVLLRYSSPGSVPTFEDAPHHSRLLLRQALALQMSPSPSTGASAILENRNMLNIPVEVPARAGPQHRRTQNRTAASTPQERLSLPARPGTVPQMGLPEMIARGLMERGESLGINRTLMNAVSELKRNIPDLTASLGRSPNSSTSALPLTDERPPWEPRSRFEMEREISTLRSTNKRLGDSLGWIVDVLLQDEAEATEPERLKKQKQEALESLSYVRDVLLGSVGEIDDSRLVGEEELCRRRRKEARTSQSSLPPIEVVVPPPPPPVSVAGCRLQTQPMRGMMSSTSAIGSGRMSETASPGARLAPWNDSESSFSCGSRTVGTEVLPRVPPRAGRTEDPLGVNT
ncbi:hypothetical protein H2248_009520 [Termitomyces sp. 'cryptogamus']|nr:hypothetical protein H2248_009520 [Termitomyces sp. 'cryptogamus']